MTGGAVAIPRWGLWLMLGASLVGSYFLARELFGGPR